MALDIRRAKQKPMLAQKKWHEIPLRRVNSKKDDSAKKKNEYESSLEDIKRQDSVVVLIRQLKKPAKIRCDKQQAKNNKVVRKAAQRAVVNGLLMAQEGKKRARNGYTGLNRRFLKGKGSKS